MRSRFGQEAPKAAELTNCRCGRAGLRGDETIAQAGKLRKSPRPREVALGAWPGRGGRGALRPVVRRTGAASPGREARRRAPPKRSRCIVARWSSGHSPKWPAFPLRNQSCAPPLQHPSRESDPTQCLLAAQNGSKIATVKRVVMSHSSVTWIGRDCWDGRRPLNGKKGHIPQQKAGVTAWARGQAPARVRKKKEIRMASKISTPRAMGTGLIPMSATSAYRTRFICQVASRAYFTSSMSGSTHVNVVKEPGTSSSSSTPRRFGKPIARVTRRLLHSIERTGIVQMVPVIAKG